MRHITLGWLFLAACAVPCMAIIVPPGDNPNGSMFEVSTINGIDLSGVVRVNNYTQGFNCTGALLSDGFSILTAAHCVTELLNESTGHTGTTPYGTTRVFAQPVMSSSPLSVADVYINPQYDGYYSDGADLAVLRLTSSLAAQRYSLYTGSINTSNFASDPLYTNDIAIAGFGVGGVGCVYNSGTCGAAGAGANSSSYPFGTLRAGQNTYDAYGTIGGNVAFLYGDTYNPNISSDAFCYWYGNCNPAEAGILSDQINIAPGDSGGPTFLPNGEIAGVHDFETCINNGSSCYVPPSVGSSVNSYSGQIFGDVNVSNYATWIQAQEVPEPAAFAFVAAGVLLIGLPRALRRRA